LAIGALTTGFTLTAGGGVAFTVAIAALTSIGLTGASIFFTGAAITGA